MFVVSSFHSPLVRSLRTALVGATALALGGCAFFQQFQQPAPPRPGVDYQPPAPPVAAPPAPAPATQTREWRAVGAGQDAAFEKSALLNETFYRNADALLRQVDQSGVMGVNRGFEAAARKGGDWYIEEQRFGDTIIGAGINRNRLELVDAGLRAFEWGFRQQSGDGGFDCKDEYFSTAYFVAGVAHALWLLDTSGYARDYSARIAAMRPKLAAAARWLADPKRIAAAKPQMDQFTSRYFITGYALAASARLTGEASLAYAGEELIRAGLAAQHASGYFPERGGFDSSFQGESIVYLLRYFDHAATADMRRSIESPLGRSIKWLESRVTPAGVIQTNGNKRTGANQERDRTGQPRRVSAVAVSRAFGLARFIFADPRFEELARRVANAKQP
jgi:hypothetical protein